MPILINGSQVESFNFPGGECHIRVFPQVVKKKTKILAILRSSDDVMMLLLVVDAIRRILPKVYIDLEIPYFPYARQDRVCNFGEALSVKVMANLINGLKCDRTLIIDPHSDVTPALLNNCEIITQADILENHQLGQKLVTENWALIAPDAGAEKKTLEVAHRLAKFGKNLDVFSAHKIRDSRTGKILETTFNHQIQGRKVILIDDICDGGRTFIELAKVLQKQEITETILYVTHGIFSKGLDVLKPYFNHIYCYHVMGMLNTKKDDFLTIFNY